MPKLPPTQNTIFNESFAALSAMKSDGHTVLHYNSSATLAIYPGEPVPKKHGAIGLVCLAQSMILPGEWKSLVRNWEAVFPCNFSADVFAGDELWWDMDNEVVTIAGLDVTNGFLLGTASYNVLPGQTVTAVADGRVKVATTASTKVQVICTNLATTLKGTAALV